MINSKYQHRFENHTSSRVCICDCDTGRFITTLTKRQIDYIYSVLIKYNNTKGNGDWLKDYIMASSFETLTDIKDYLPSSSSSPEQEAENL